MIPLVDLQAQYRLIKPQVDTAIERVLGTAEFILGQEVERFEAAYALYGGARYAVGVASGTAALHLALLAAGTGPGDEVITTPLTFIATVEAIVRVGARPVFVDINPDTYNIDPERVQRAISPRTRAIVPVHLYGQMADMSALARIADDHGLAIIEDAAQAHGATWLGQPPGAHAVAAAYSFYPGKNLGAYGDAGAVITNHLPVADRIRALRDHGRTSKYEHGELGFGERLDGLQAAILGAKLPFLEQWTEQRRAAAARYDELLGSDRVVRPAVAAAARHVYHLYVIQVDDRDRVLDSLQARGIGASIHYPIPLHCQPALRHLGYADGDFPVAERASQRILSLPLFPEITAEQQQEVAEAVRALAIPRA